MIKEGRYLKQARRLHAGDWRLWKIQFFMQNFNPGFINHHLWRAFSLSYEFREHLSGAQLQSFIWNHAGRKPHKNLLAYYLGMLCRTSRLRVFFFWWAFHNIFLQNLNFHLKFLAYTIKKKILHRLNTDWSSIVLLNFSWTPHFQEGINFSRYYEL